MAKHKYIETPEKMWELFEEYVAYIHANPIKVQDFVGKDGKEVYRLKQKPATMEGFRVFSFNKGYSIKHYFENTNDSYKEYLPICTHIKDVIRQDQIEGGMAGIYNPSITQRLNGLVEKTDNKNENLNKNIDITMDLGDIKPNEDKL